MNNQEAFNKIWQHFIVEGNPQSMVNSFEGTCAYRGINGPNAKCAVGCLIPDELYSKDFEYRKINYLMEAYSEIRELFSGVNLDFLKECQYWHDYRFSELPDALVKLATKWNLTVPEGPK